MLGTVVDAKYVLDVNAKPYPHLDLTVPSAEGSPVVRHIFRLEDGDNTLHLCSPFMVPPDQRPTKFEGGGYVKMVRGPKQVSEAERAKRAQVEGMGFSEKLESFLGDALAVVPGEDTRPLETDNDAVIQTKMAANVRFQSAYQTLVEMYGVDVETRVKELVMGVRSKAEETPAVQARVKEFHEKMAKAGLVPPAEELEEMVRRGEVVVPSPAGAGAGTKAGDAAESDKADLADRLQQVVLNEATAVKSSASASTAASTAKPAAAGKPAKPAASVTANSSNDTVVMVAAVGVVLAAVAMAWMVWGRGGRSSS